MLFVCAGVILVISLLEKENKFINPEEEIVAEITEEENSTPKTIRLCFKSQKPEGAEIYDTSWVLMDITGEKINGEFQYLPAEKDSRVGEFQGIVGPVDPNTMSRVADVWWDSSGEGVEATEQLRIIFGEGLLQVGFGEMEKIDEGVYAYKDIEKLYYSIELFDINCEDLVDQI